MELFTNFLSGIWNLFESVTVPGINISFAQMWLGVFVVGISISILRPLLGIGFGAVNNILSAGKRGYDRAYRKAQVRRNEKQHSKTDSNKENV